MEGVLLVKGAAGEERDAHGGEEAVAYVVEGDLFAVAGGVRDGLKGDEVGPIAGIEAHEGEAVGLDARDCLDVLLDLLLEVLGHGLFAVMGKVGRGAIQEEDQGIVPIEAGVVGGEFDQAAEEEAGGGEQQDGERDLADDEAAGERVAGGRGAAAVAERWGERTVGFEAGGAQGGQDAEEQDGEDGNQQGKGENGQVGREVDGDQRWAGRGQVEEHGGGAPGEGDSEERAEDGQEGGLGEELEDDAGAGRSEGHADGHFTGAGDAPGEEHVGDVGAGDEQDQGDDGHQDLEREGEIQAQRGKAAGGGGEADMGALQVGEVFGGWACAEEVVAEHLLKQDVGFQAGLLGGDAGLEAGDEVERLEPLVGEAVAVGGDLLLHGKGNPEVGGVADGRAQEARFGYADERVVVVGDVDDFAEDAGVRVGVALEPAVAGDGYGARAGGLIVGGEDGAAENGGDAEHVEIAAGDEVDLDFFEWGVGE